MFLYCEPGFAVYSLMLISIEKEITEMKLDIDRVIRLFFSLKYDLLYRLGFYIGFELVPKCTLSIYTRVL